MASANSLTKLEQPRVVLFGVWTFLMILFQQVRFFFGFCEVTLAKEWNVRQLYANGMRNSTEPLFTVSASEGPAFGTSPAPCVGRRLEKMAARSVSKYIIVPLTKHIPLNPICESQSWIINHHMCATGFLPDHLFSGMSENSGHLPK